MTDPCQNAVEVVDGSSAQVLDTLPTDQAPNGIVISPDGSRLYIAHAYYSSFAKPDGSSGPAQGSVSLVDLHGGGFRSIMVPGMSGRLALTPDGGLLYVTIPAPNPGRVAVVDTATEAVMTTLLVGSASTDVAAAPAPAAAAPPSSTGGSGSGCNMMPSTGGSGLWVLLLAAAFCAGRRRGIGSAKS